MKKAIAKFGLVTVLSLVWGYVVVAHFYGELSKFWFITTFSIFGVPAYILATHMANKLLRQRSNFKVAVHESLTRDLFGRGLLILIALFVTYVLARWIVI